MFISSSKSKKDWSEYTLVVPAVSVGNVGQLAADVLISSLWLRRVGYFHDDSFLPVIGNDPFAAEDASKRCSLMTAAEVFEGEQNKLVVIQQRSPLVKGKRGQYTEKLLNWIKENKFHDVIILTGSFAHERRDAQLVGNQLRFLLSEPLEKDEGETLRKNLGWKELEKRTALPGDFMHDNPEEIFIPGGGIAKSLFQKCSGEGLRCAVVLLFCSEGDNAMDAVQLASAVNDWKIWIDLNKSEELTQNKVAPGWRIPISWKLQYGSRFDQSLFQ